MMTVITTCCPYGNLEKIVTTLQQAGLDLKNDAFVQWHDMVFGPSGSVDPLEIDQQSLQGVEINDGILEDSSEVREAPLLMADNRCLWLLETWAAKLPEAKFLLFYTHVDSALAYACRHGIEPQQALDSWQLACRQLLKFQRSNRRRSLLLDADAAIRQPQALVDVCSRIGLTLQSVPPHDETVSKQADLERYLAKLLINDQPGLQALEAELAASAHPLEDGPPVEMQPMELFNQHRQWLVDHRKTLQERDETVKKLQFVDNALNEQQIQMLHLQAEKDYLNRAYNDQVELNVEQQIRFESVQQANQELEATANEISLKNDKLILQLNHAQEKLGKTLLQRQELEQQKQKDQDAQQKFKAQFNRLTKDYGEQVKLNKEQEAKLANVQQEHQELRNNILEMSEENDLLLLQLHQVQEELEKTFLQKQDVEKAEKEQKVAKQESQRQIDKLNKGFNEQVRLNAEHQSKLKNVLQDHQKLEELIKKITKEKEHLLQQLSEMQGKQKNTFLQKEELEQQIKTLHVTQQASQAQVDKLIKACDEQKKANNEQQNKLEKVQQAFQKLEANNKEMIEENDVLLLQLHQLQEELEKIFLQKQQLERQIQLNKTTENVTNQELQQIKDELLNKKRELEKQHQRMTKLKETVSWKITAPMRSIGKPFKKLSKERIKTQEQIKLLRTSGLFDEAWYNATYEDVVKNRYDPVEHYIRFGAAEGRDPSPIFNTQRYLECNPDVADAGMNALVHYAKYGVAEQRYLG